MLLKTLGLLFIALGVSSCGLIGGSNNTGDFTTGAVQSDEFVPLQPSFQDGSPIAPVQVERPAEGTVLGFSRLNVTIDLGQEDDPYYRILLKGQKTLFKGGKNKRVTFETVELKKARAIELVDNKEWVFRARSPKNKFDVDVICDRPFKCEKVRVNFYYKQPNGRFVKKSFQTKGIMVRVPDEDSDLDQDVSESGSIEDSSDFVPEPSPQEENSSASGSSPDEPTTEVEGSSAPTPSSSSEEGSGSADSHDHEHDIEDESDETFVVSPPNLDVRPDEETITLNPEEGQSEFVEGLREQAEEDLQAEIEEAREELGQTEEENSRLIFPLNGNLSGSFSASASDFHGMSISDDDYLDYSELKNQSRGQQGKKKKGRVVKAGSLIGSTPLLASFFGGGDQDYSAPYMLRKGSLYRAYGAKLVVESLREAALPVSTGFDFKLNHSRGGAKSYTREGQKACFGDLSLKEGGILDSHISHQNGLDVDVYYFKQDSGYLHQAKGCKVNTVNSRGQFIDKNFDVARNWKFLETLYERAVIESKEVNYSLVANVFVDRKIKNRLCDHAKQMYGTKSVQQKHHKAFEVLRRLIVLTKSNGADGTSHRDHMHIRFFCHTSGCSDIGRPLSETNNGCSQ